MSQDCDKVKGIHGDKEDSRGWKAGEVSSGCMKVLTWPGCGGWKTRSSGTPAHVASTGTLPVPSPLPCCCSLHTDTPLSPAIHFCLTLLLLLLLQPADTDTPTSPSISIWHFLLLLLQPAYTYTSLHHPFTSVWHCFFFCYCSLQIHIHPSASKHFSLILLLLQPADTNTPPSPSTHLWYCFCFCYYSLQIHNVHHLYTSVWHRFCFCYHSLQIHHLHIHTLLSDTVSAFVTTACRYTTFTSIHFCLTLFLLLLPQPADTPPSHPYTSVWHCFCFCYHSLQIHHLHIHTLLSDTVSAFATAACRYTTFTSIHFCLTPFLFLLPLPADTYTSLHGCFLGIRWTWKWDYFYSFTMHCNNLIQSGA